jgi:hypothetical protein
MRKLLLMLILVGYTGWAQNLNNHWVLGVSDVNFTTNPPVVGTVANSGQYGIATISDANGNLLFYTDGAIVWNKNHAVMTNGSPQVPPYINNVIIVPNPANSNQYYIFRAIQYNTLGSSSTCMYTYSIVEFNVANPLGILLNINAFPDGSITNNYSLRLKDSTGSDITNMWDFSPLTVAYNAANDGYWIIGQRDTKIVSYTLNASGFNPVPVESTFTNAQIYNPGVNHANPGYGGFDIEGRVKQIFKMSPNNAKLGGLITTSRQNMPSYTSDFYTLNFNSTTGQFSNFVAVHNENSFMYPKMIQEFEFSNNSDNVYFVRFPFNLNTPPSPLGEIIVKNLSNLSNPERILAEFGNPSSFPAYFNFIQRDKHGNVLISSSYTNASRNQYIHKIDSQDSYSNSSVVLNSISLNAHPISILPQLIPILNNPCPNTLLVTQNVTTGQDNRQAVNSIEATNVITGATTVSIYHAGDFVLLKPPFNVAAGAKLHAYIAGCTGTFLLRQSQDEVETDENSIAATSRDDAKKAVIRISPNPGDGDFKVTLNDMMEGSLEISDLFGVTVFRSVFRNQNEIEVNIQDKPKGIYIVKVISDNQIYTGKIIKN